MKILTEIEKYKGVIAIIGGLSLLALLALWILAKSEEKKEAKSGQQV